MFYLVVLRKFPRPSTTVPASQNRVLARYDAAFNSSQPDIVFELVESNMHVHVPECRYWSLTYGGCTNAGWILSRLAAGL